MSILDLRPPHGGVSKGPSAVTVTKLLDAEQLLGAFVIIETPSVVGSAGAQAASQAADAAILVIDTRLAKVAETREAVGVLRQSGVRLLGAVLAPVSNEESSPDGADPNEGDGGQPRSPGLDRASATGSTGWSWSTPSNGSAKSSVAVDEFLKIAVSTDQHPGPDRSPPDDVTQPAKDAIRNGASSRGAKTGKR
jgi:hypothetical protein